MKIVLTAMLACLAVVSVSAQPRRAAKRPQTTPPKAREVGSTAVVMDETLSVLRLKPSLYGVPVQRMRRGRTVKILGVAETDGIKFFRVSAPPSSSGWVQAEAIFGSFREGDDARLARLVQSLSGFDQIEAAAEFFILYPSSQFRPALMLLYGDLLEDTAAKLSKDANSRLDRRQMAATGASPHSYYLNYVGLDRYRKLGVIFQFNLSTRLYHYDGASWGEIVKKYPDSPEAAEARKRLDTLKEKLAKKV